MTAAATALVIEKAPRGGFSLKEVKFSDNGDRVTLETIAFRSSLVEISALEHAMKEERFEEAAWYAMPRQPPVQYQLPQPQPQYTPPLPPRMTQPPAEHADLEMPKVVTDQQIPLPDPDPSVVNRISEQMRSMGRNGRLAAALFCTLLVLSSMAQRMA